MSLDYPALIREALRSVVRRVLEQVAAEGLPGEHHLYLTFRTDDPEVSMPRALRDVYPGEMTIVLQHQFWDLQVEPERFAVTLRFGGSPQRLSVPFTALTAFVDPVGEIGLRFDEMPAGGGEPEPAAGGSAGAEPGSGQRPDTRPGGGEVISIDKFRKRE